MEGIFFSSPSLSSFSNTGFLSANSFISFSSPLFCLTVLLGVVLSKFLACSFTVLRSKAEASGVEGIFFSSPSLSSFSNTGFLSANSFISFSSPLFCLTVLLGVVLSKFLACSFTVLRSKAEASGVEGIFFSSPSLSSFSNTGFLSANSFISFSSPLFCLTVLLCCK